MKWLCCCWLAVFSTLGHAEIWRFALIGDTPYSDYERRELPAMLRSIADHSVDFIVHAGDIKHSNEACSDALFNDRFQLFNSSLIPFVYVPGDNEWVDCKRVIAGHYDPQERLDALRHVFHAGNESLGQRRLLLQRQAGSYREHQRWQLGPVLFTSLNVPGPNNNSLASGEASPEAASRMPHVMDWLRESFAVARTQQLAGIVLVMQANPGFKHFASGVGQRAFRLLLETVREETMNFRGQVLLVHGDTHWHRIDHPLRHPASGKRLSNFTRVETFGYPYLGWVKVYVDTEQPSLFRFESHPWPSR